MAFHAFPLERVRQASEHLLPGSRLFFRRLAWESIVQSPSVVGHSGSEYLKITEYRRHDAEMAAEDIDQNNDTVTNDVRKKQKHRQKRPAERKQPAFFL